MDDLSKKIISMLKSNAYHPVLVNTLPKLPIVITREGAFSNKVDERLDNGDTYPINSNTGEEYLDGVDLIIHSIMRCNTMAEKIAYLRLLSGYDNSKADQNTYPIVGDTYPIDLYSNREFLDGVHALIHDTYTTDKEAENVVYLRTMLLWWLWRKARIVNVKKFHYDDTWYSYRDSIDHPEETFGILEVSNLPFRPFTKLINKKSFICRMDQLMFNGIMEPFMVFINNKFVNWNCIDIVFDCDDVYLLLHGKEYSYQNLKNVDISIVVLPFKVEYVGTETDDIWNKNYDMLYNYLQDSLHVNNNDKIEIEVPTMYSIYKKRGMVYNVGAWMYVQVYMNHLGLLSQDRVNKLKRIILTRITYDDSGNIISKYDTKFNALDRDSYDRNIYGELCHCSLDYLKKKAILRFNDEGLLDLDNGSNIIANLDESLTVVVEQHRESNIILNNSNFYETLFRESFLVFESGYFYPDCIIDSHGMNIFSINNPNKLKYVTLAFKPAMIETIIKHSDNFINRDYYIDKILKHIKPNENTTLVEDYNNNKKLISLSNEPLNYLYFDNLLYEENFNFGFRSVMEFNPLLLNDLTKTTIKSTVIYGREANEYLDKAFGIETRAGLKIPRYRYRDHETYVIVFLNGELIENYSEMYAASNYFFLPIENEFSNGDVIEFLFFTYCDNNEIHFNITDKMIEKFNSSGDYKFINGSSYDDFYNEVQDNKYDGILTYDKYYEDANNGTLDGVSSYIIFYNKIKDNKYSDEYILGEYNEYIGNKYKEYLEDKFNKLSIFSKYIKPEDIKIFAKYPEEIMIYKDLIEERKDIAFNVSYRDTKGNLLLFSDVVENKYNIERPYYKDIDGNIYYCDEIENNKMAIGKETYYCKNPSDIRYNEDGKYIISDDMIKINFVEPENKFTAVSSRKFIYERLYVDQKAYRIKLGERFRYCDNQKQYILFINGRRMEDDSFFITVPKYSRPFWGIYLYTRKFVGPEDRIEIFYVPEELYNINTEEMVPTTFGTNGYIETDKNNLTVPFNSDFYLYFVNGKKIPSSHIIPIDSHTLRVKSDTKTLLRFNINPIFRSTDPAITSYMKSDKESKYDRLIKYIKDTFGYSELDALFNSRMPMTDTEDDAIWRNANRINIINEIVRDFWVSSGYQYNEKPFVYDYELDEIIVKDRNGNYILPALDATQPINIVKNYITLLYFNMNKETNIYEIGSTVSDITFDWEFSTPLSFATITLVSQYVNDIRLDAEDRSYTYYDEISEDTRFHFKFNTMQSTIEKLVEFKFYNGIYYGTVDEDLLQHYNKIRDYLSLDKIIAVVAKDKRMPSSAEQEIENESIEIIKKDNYIIYNLKFIKDYEGIMAIYNNTKYKDIVAVYEDGKIYGDINISGDNISGTIINAEEASEFIDILDDIDIKLDEYLDKNDLGRLMSTLNRTYQDTTTLDFESYVIGSNNYFVYACPKRLAYNRNGKLLIDFNMPDVNDQDVIDYGKDDHTTPIYTDGNFDKLDNTLIKLDECKMEFMDEFEYTNPSGYTETYVIWKTNGFFTRKYDDYEFKMSIKSTIDVEEPFQTVITEDNTVDGDIINTGDDVIETPVIEETLTPTVEQIRIVNTASPTGADVNDNIVFIDTLIW